MTNKEQIEALYVTAQKLSDDFELTKLEANEYINQLLISAGIEKQVSDKQSEVEAKRAEIQIMVDAILEKIRELQTEETPE
jgi:ribosome assembly protein YihI (activator of Der GTPase)